MQHTCQFVIPETIQNLMHSFVATDLYDLAHLMGLQTLSHFAPGQTGQSVVRYTTMSCCHRLHIYSQQLDLIQAVCCIKSNTEVNCLQCPTQAGCSLSAQRFEGSGFPEHDHMRNQTACSAYPCIKESRGWLTEAYLHNTLTYMAEPRSDTASSPAVCTALSCTN